MNPLYDWYENACESVAQYERERPHNHEHYLDEQVDEMVKEWKGMIAFFDQQHPEIKSMYMRKKSFQNSFTPDQINFICDQIGDWYLMMKPLLKGQHNLGHMKEKLKMMICGNN